jgi:hypothetical protein
VSTASPQIGIDRFVDVVWMQLAASVVRGEMHVDGLHARLAVDIPGLQVRRKTAGILNRMWFPQDAALRSLAENAAGLAIDDNAENLGRLLRLQGSCSAGEVHRRMFEQHGKRTTIDQATSYCFKTMASWGMIVRSPDRRLTATEPQPLRAPARQLLDKAANLSRHSVTPLLTTDPLLFPFQPF